MKLDRTIAKVRKKATVRSGARKLAREVEKRMAKKAATKAGLKTASKVAGKLATKGNIVLVPADIIQTVVEEHADSTGSKELKVVAKSVGAGAYVAVGAGVGGPVGALAGAAIWGFGELVSKILSK